MNGGRSDTSEQESPQGFPPEDLNDALDRLRTRIQEVAEWAEHASIPGAPVVVDLSERAEPTSSLSAPAERRDESGASPRTPSEVDVAPSPLFSFVEDLAQTGKLTSGIFVAGGNATELELDGKSHVPFPGLLALVGLIPPETVLEIRTTSAEWRAARIGDEAFAVELSEGSKPEVDEWLATLLPPEKD